MILSGFQNTLKVGDLEEIIMTLDAYKKEIGGRIRMLRNELNMTQREFAMKVGCNPKYLSKIETGKALCSMQIIVKINMEFDSPYEELLFDYPNKRDQICHVLDSLIGQIESLKGIV